MTALSWGDPGARTYEVGVDRGVLYPTTGAGVAWNGLTKVTDSPSGGDESPIYADNSKFLTFFAIEDYGGTIEAFSAPYEFNPCLGITIAYSGMLIAQQSRQKFSFSYRTKLGNDLVGIDYGYKIYLVYQASIKPSDQSYDTVGESPEAASYSWDFSTIPVSAGSAYSSTAHVMLDSTKLTSSALTAIESILYGSASADPRVLLPPELMTIIANSPAESYYLVLAYNSSTQLFQMNQVSSGTDDIVPTATDGIYAIGTGSGLTLTSTDGIYSTSS